MINPIADQRVESDVLLIEIGQPAAEEMKNKKEIGDDEDAVDDELDREMSKSVLRASAFHDECSAGRKTDRARVIWPLDARVRQPENPLRAGRFFLLSLARTLPG